MSLYRRLSGNYLFRNTSLTAALSALGALAGLVLDALVVYTFGVGKQTDAFFAAITIPNLLVGVVSIQSPKVLVPIFTELFGKSEKDGWELLQTLLTSAAVAFAAVSLIGAVASSIIMPLQIPGLDGNAVALAIWFSRVLFALVLLQGVAAVMQSVLYARHSYIVSSSGKVITNVVSLSVLVMFRAQVGIRALAFGTLLGAVAQLVALQLVLRSHGFRFRWRWRPSDARLRQIVADFGYPCAGHVLGESASVLQNLLGSLLGSGSLTLLRYAARITQAIAGILLGSVVRVTLPLISKHAAAKDLPKQKRAFIESLQLVALVGLPICVWLTCSAQSLVTVLFQRGEFSPHDAIVTGVIIQAMVPDLLLGRLVSVTQTLFYANGDLRTPFVSTVLYTIVNATAAVLLSMWLGVTGVGLAVSLASLSNATYMAAKLQNRFEPVGWFEMRPFWVRLTFACALAAGGFIVGAQGRSLIGEVGGAAKYVEIGLSSALGFGVFGACALLFGLLDAGVRPAPAPQTLL
jgi:putative peptidoglycan lipid II flippase